jgi:3-phosphoshikimate 1-carboxyvinyltransferase
MDFREIIPLKNKLEAVLTLPGSKSITNRAFFCAALAGGVSRISGALKSDDTRVMLEALRKLGVRIKETKKGIEIIGCEGRFDLKPVTVEVGASGTTTRFLTALSILKRGKVTMKGSKRMMERPMEDLHDALDQYRSGAEIIKVRGDKSSQFLSALLMVAPLIGPLKIQVIGKLVSKPYIDTTLAVMKAFGVKVTHHDYQFFEIGRQEYKAVDYQVEGDASAASYFLALEFLHGGKVRFENLDLKHSIQGDAKFTEALALLKKRSPRTIDMEAMPDTALTLACVAPFVFGQTKITGLSTLRLKETDRLAALETELKKLGVKARKTKDSLILSKGDAPNSYQIHTYDDHRMAMSFAVLGTKIPGVVIEDPGCTAKTYPNFWEDLEKMYLSSIKLGKKNLVLTGMRCTGKTFHGKRIARKLGRKFVDLDLLIEKRKKMKIPEIVKRYGWPYFREIEQKICSEFSGADSLVIATGGGVVLSPKGMKPLLKNSVNVFIYTDPHVLAKRIKRQGGRPSLSGKKLEDETADIWGERRDLYINYADIIWDDTSGKVLQDFDFIVESG